MRKVSGSVPGWSLISPQLCVSSVFLCGFSPRYSNVLHGDLFIWREFKLRGHVRVDLAAICTLKLDKTQRKRETHPAQSSNGERLFINEDPCGALLNTAGWPEIRGTTSD